MRWWGERRARLSAFTFDLNPRVVYDAISAGGVQVVPVQGDRFSGLAVQAGEANPVAIDHALGAARVDREFARGGEKFVNTKSVGAAKEQKCDQRRFHAWLEGRGGYLPQAREG